MISNQYTITTTRQIVVAAASANRQVYLHVLGTNVVYLGGSDVNVANGLPTEKGGIPFEICVPAGENLYAVSASGTEDLRVLRASHDGN